MLWIQEEFFNATKGYRFSQSAPYETAFDDTGKLFRSLQSEYGRCVSRVYVGTKTGTKRIGWVFEKRMRYEDSKGHYTREVWVTVLDKADTVTRERHYHAFNSVTGR